MKIARRWRQRPGVHRPRGRLRHRSHWSFADAITFTTIRAGDAPIWGHPLCMPVECSVGPFPKILSLALMPKFRPNPRSFALRRQVVLALAASLMAVLCASVPARVTAQNFVIPTGPQPRHTTPASSGSLAQGTVRQASSGVVRQPGAGVPTSPTASAPQIRLAAARMQATETATSDPAEDAAPLLDAEELTNEEAITTAIANVKESDIDDDLRERILKILATAHSAYKDRRSDSEKQSSYEKTLSTIGFDTADARRQVEAKEPSPVERPDSRFLSLEQLRQELANQDAVVEAARQKLQAINQEISQRQPRRAALPQLIAEAKQQLADLQSKGDAKPVDDENGDVAEALQAQREAQIAATEQRIKTLENELKAIEAEADLLPLNRTLAERELARATQLQQYWAEAVRQSKEARTRSDLRQYRDSLSETEAEESAILKSEDSWIEILSETERVRRRLTEEEAKAEEITRLLNEKIETIERDLESEGRIRPSLGVELQLLQGRLPDPGSLASEIRRVRTRIDQLRAEKAELQIQTQWNSSASSSLWSGSIPKSQISETEQRLLDRFIADIDTDIDLHLRTQRQLETQQSNLDELRHLINRHVLWIRNRSPLSMRDFPTAWNSLIRIMHPFTLGQVLTAFWVGLKGQPHLPALLILALLSMIFAGTRLRRRMTALAKKARAWNTTSLVPTLSAILITVALALPVFILLYFIGEAIEKSESSDRLIQAYAQGFKVAAYFILPLELMRQVLRPQGLAIAHFNSDEPSVEQLRKGLRILIDVGLPILLLWTVCQQIGNPQVEGSLGRGLFVAGMFLASVFFWDCFHPKHGIFTTRMQHYPDSWLSRLRMFWFPLIVATPFILCTISLLGYQYAALSLAECGYGTIWLIVIAFVVSGFLWRWLLLQRRRVAYALYKEKRDETDRVNVEGFDIEQEDNLPAAEISAQTTRMMQAIIWLSVIVGLVLVWAPVLPAVEFLNRFELWSVSVSNPDGTVEVRWITLANVVLAIPVVVLTWVIVRNLPGLVEGLLLERLPIDKAARYAITSVGTYALAAFGIFMSCQTLGLRWDSIQWLVAALGVGLGFGLQEIFANFISGIILLFEQPIRVGDIVTLGDTTGVVSRIRIRATTITNWDRQELVVPNKDLVTGRLINWTLTDSTNRVVMNIGIAYGSDTRRACELLKEICDQHENISEDPGPIVTFEGFGDSTLNLVLRCYLSTLDVRLTTIHELHTAINDRFNAEGIEIAFPQRDLHIRSFPPGMTVPTTPPTVMPPTAGGSETAAS